MFAADTFGVMPDVICTAKGLSGGFAPLSAMICRKPIADAFWGPIATNPGFVEGHTFEGNPISCAAGIAVLREILEHDLCGNARSQGERLRAGFQKLADKYGIIGDIRGKGLLQGIEFVKDWRRRSLPGQRRASASALAGGRWRTDCSAALIRTGWRLGRPLIVTEGQLDEMLAVLDRSMGEVLSETLNRAIPRLSTRVFTRRFGPTQMVNAHGRERLRLRHQMARRGDAGRSLPDHRED